LFNIYLGYSIEFQIVSIIQRIHIPSIQYYCFIPTYNTIFSNFSPNDFFDVIIFTFISDTKYVYVWINVFLFLLFPRVYVSTCITVFFFFGVELTSFLLLNYLKTNHDSAPQQFNNFSLYSVHTCYTYIYIYIYVHAIMSLYKHNNIKYT